MPHNQLSSQMRDLLIEHIDGPRRIHISDYKTGNRLLGAAKLGYLSFDRQQFPRSTAMTARGRAALCAALGEWADALVRAKEAANARGIELAEFRKTA